MRFETDPRLLANSIPVAHLGLSDLRLMDDARFPWLVLIPRVAGASELDDLDERQRADLMTEMVAAGKMVRQLGQARGRPVDKINTAALGNVTAQLHVHIVGRRRDDCLWPDPIWGRGERVATPESELKQLARLIASEGATSQG